MAGIVLAPTNSIALLTGASVSRKITDDETHRHGSISATEAASPRLALTGEVVLRLPSVFIRTVRAPDTRAGFQTVSLTWWAMPKTGARG